MVIGILAHVDAGKTTLSESILYHTGAIRKMGRVDNGDAFLDTEEMEKARGITIYAKEAVFTLGGREVYLIDTPGHVDFSSEMERALQVLDYAILVISATDGIQSHTATLWRLLELYNIPVFLFVNKMDLTGADRETLSEELERLGHGSCVDFSDIEDRNAMEAIAMCDESVLDYFMEHGRVEDRQIAEAVAQRKLFPCYFGSALKDTGIEEFLAGFDRYTREKSYGDEFRAKVYKVARDGDGTRLTYMKITGGSLKVKSSLSYRDKRGESVEEKIDRIRIYSGGKYESVGEVRAGTVCAVTGLSETSSGEELGVREEPDIASRPAVSLWNPVLEPVLMYRIKVPEGTDMQGLLKNLRQLEEEEPQLHIVWNERFGEIYAKVMGEVQKEILGSVIRDRYGIEADFDSGSIVYKETIAEAVEGVGHFEPLRHYAEVHLLLEPAERGSGLVFASACSEDILHKNWQKLILTHLREKEHMGVLTGSPITDMKITLVSGRAHQKHTEGGDFRQATYRAVRQGLKEAETILLEPYYSYRLELPAEYIGHAMADIQRMKGSFEGQENDGVTAVLEGRCPVCTMGDYGAQVISYTKGKGKLYLNHGGYDVCHNAEEVVENRLYDSESDLDNPTGSVFCAHGTGFYVNWDEVKKYMHLESVLVKPKNTGAGYQIRQQGLRQAQREKEAKDFYAGEKELKEIFERTYKTSYNETKKPEERKTAVYKSSARKEKEYVYKGGREKREEYLLVDGYNIIFAWEELKELSEQSFDGARISLLEILCNYQGYTGCHLIVVFDAYKVQGNKGNVEKYKNIHVVYTKEAETADQYIEKTVHNIGNRYRVTVATSDRLEQMIIMGDGAARMSAQGFKAEVERVSKSIADIIIT